MEVKLGDFAISFSESGKQVRRMSDLKNLFSDKKAADLAAKSGNPVVYEVYAKESEDPDGLSYAVTVINPGEVGGEYFMTKGHFHAKPTGELYLGLEGSGILLLQDRKGNTQKVKIEPGKISYVPSGYAHRSVNTGNGKLKFLAVYRADSGHDYITVEKEGFKDKIKKN